METFKSIMDYIVIPVVMPACAFMIGWLIRLEKRTLPVKDMKKKISALEKKHELLDDALDKINTTLEVNKTTLTSNETMLKTITDHFLNKGLRD